MPSTNVREQLTKRLADELGLSVATEVVRRIESADTQPAEIFVLLDELEAVSGKIARAAIEALPELDRRAGCSLLIAWLDLGVALAESSGATALKYFKDSPLILGVIEEAEQRRAVLAIGLEIAEDDPNVTWEYLKASPQLVTAVPAQHLSRWLEIGVEATRSDPVVGLEYIRQIPALAPILSSDEVRQWLAFGMKLIAPNAFGKPDYFPTMEYLRSSPAILGDIEAPLRAHVVTIGTLLAALEPAAGIAWLAESPALLRALPSSPWRLKLLQYGALLAEQNADAAMSYFRKGPELIGLLGEELSAFSRFENWFKAGMEVLSYSPEGARAYFAAESRQALSSVETALSGVPLRHVARRLKLFVEALCGSEVSIAAGTGDAGGAAARATVTADGKAITLPALLRRYSSAEENERLYLIMAAHEAGHLEFGTYRLRIDALIDLASAVADRYGRPRSPALQTLSDLFRLYPQPRLMHDLWTVLEDARVESMLQHHYPGLRGDLAQLAADTVTARDPAHALTARELVVDCLLRLSTGASLSSAVPRAIAGEVSILWQLCQPVVSLTATAEDAVRIADEVYVRLEQLVAAAPKTPADSSISDARDFSGQRGTANGDDTYQEMENLLYRGEMNADLVAGRTEEQPAPKAAGGAGSAELRDVTTQDGREQQSMPAGEALAGGRSLPNVVDELLAVDVEAQLIEAGAGEERICRYPEWDFRLQDHRVNWCRVVERMADRGSDECVSGTLNAHRSTVRLLRRSFESLRPPAFRRVAGQPDGDDLDLDALVRRAAEQQAGLEGGDRIYVRHEKRRRDVAVLFLVDVSGSTGRQIDRGRRVIDVEKESLVLLCEALDAVGDQYALYAYSGQGRGGVDVRAIKQFDEPLGVRTAERLGGLAPGQQNRDGAAIRHAVARLRQRDVKTRLLVLLSDGRPLDGDYSEDYALEDTKAALREARREGIHPFCVTIDSEADRYVRRMYGDVEYTVIDRVESLPARLPRIYQRLAT
jgi:nitric oxide reductase NorD protein